MSLRCRPVRGHPIRRSLFCRFYHRTRCRGREWRPCGAFNLGHHLLTIPPMTRTRLSGMGCKVFAAALSVIAGAGCESLTSVNSRLNGPRVPLERRLTNSTRAATSVAVAPSDAESMTRLRAPMDGAADESEPTQADGPDVRPDG